MNDAENKKLDQLIVMLADLEATFGDRFDKIDDRFSKHDRRLETVADRLLAVEKRSAALTAVSPRTKPWHTYFTN